MAVPTGLSVYRNWLTPEVQTAVIASLDQPNAAGQSPWRTDLNRKTQHYGARYDYKTKRVKYDVPPLTASPSVKQVADILTPRFAQYGSVPPNQCIVNNYLSGEHISAHTDSKEFGPVIITVSLGSSTQFILTKPGAPKYEFTLNGGDVLILSGEARTHWKHATASVTGANYRHVSMTYRTLV